MNSKLVLFLSLAFMTGCSKIASLIGAGDASADLGEGGVVTTSEAGPGKTAAKSTPPPTDLTSMRDPVEGAFTIGMPKGWQNRAYSARVFDIHSAVITTVSPDGSVLVYSGDPSLPQYWTPAHATPVHHDMTRFNPRMKIEAFVPATKYFPDYVQKKFGKLTDFKLISTEADPVAEAKMREAFAAAGMGASKPTAANVSFSYTDNGKPMRALVVGSTTDSGPFWIPTVSGIATTGEPKDYVDMLNAMGRSYVTDPSWQAEQTRKHQAQMAQIDEFGRQMTAQHQRNMAAIQASAQRHQQRMAAIQASNDASMKAFNDRMASSDAQHRAFLNYINDEHTVSAGGKSFQVDNSYQRYFVNKQNGTYVGGDVTMDPDKLRSMGLNPNDYEEAKIVR